MNNVQQEVLAPAVCQAPAAFCPSKAARGLIASLFHALVRKFDTMLGVTNHHMHHIVDTSFPAFIKILMTNAMALHRQVLPVEAQYVARIQATRSVDCGVCVQVTVNMALKEGVHPEIITAVLEDRPESLSAELRDVHAFTEHILKHTWGEGELREVLRARYGEKGLVDLAYAVATAQIMPLTKQVLGFAASCSRVQVVMPSRAA